MFLGDCHHCRAEDSFSTFDCFLEPKSKTFKPPVFQRSFVPFSSSEQAPCQTVGEFKKASSVGMISLGWRGYTKKNKDSHFNTDTLRTRRLELCIQGLLPTGSEERKYTGLGIFLFQYFLIFKI